MTSAKDRFYRYLPLKRILKRLTAKKSRGSYTEFLNQKTAFTERLREKNLNTSFRLVITVLCEEQDTVWATLNGYARENGVGDRRDGYNGKTVQRAF